MSDDICTECGERLELDQDWIIKDTSLLGTTAEGPLSEAYLHRECASEEHVWRVHREADP